MNIIRQHEHIITQRLWVNAFIGPVDVKVLIVSSAVFGDVWTWLIVVYFMHCGDGLSNIFYCQCHVYVCSLLIFGGVVVVFFLSIPTLLDYLFLCKRSLFMFLVTVACCRY